MRFGRWRACRSEEVPEVRERLETWSCAVGGAVRHMFTLATLEAAGPGPIRLTGAGDRWACAVVFPGRLVVPAGDAEAIRRAGLPVRRWRLLIGDVEPANAILAAERPDPELRVHHQRFHTVDPERVPDRRDLPDPGLRPAERVDIPALAELAAQLHVDDDFGPDPGRVGRRGYARRLETTVREGLVWCVGPPGQPLLKVERSVSSRRYGVQLAGIVVDARHRGQGLGTLAVAEAVRRSLAFAERPLPVTLHVRSANEPARRVYRAAGFVDREEWRLAVRP